MSSDNPESAKATIRQWNLHKDKIPGTGSDVQIITSRMISTQMDPTHRKIVDSRRNDYARTVGWRT
ncbi:hypothetical protein PISMIDRAFT_670016 [Pisolithus microcarpus 441]|uniref:Uncharacterized protein n=1 Tax=Pisolithus microcarpus 441 TaxID=765257 RepID=A0A0C9ZP00_9AGAM|nr:hypothetical protein PISMIDRAFT_670016 [Pisolithus microcarpus 441]